MTSVQPCTSQHSDELELRGMRKQVPTSTPFQFETMANWRPYGQGVQGGRRLTCFDFRPYLQHVTWVYKNSRRIAAGRRLRYLYTVSVNFTAHCVCQLCCSFSNLEPHAASGLPFCSLINVHFWSFETPWGLLTSSPPPASSDAERL